jgi:hypothetical protein
LYSEQELPSDFKLFLPAQKSMSQLSSAPVAEEEVLVDSNGDDDDLEEILGEDGPDEEE